MAIELPCSGCGKQLRVRDEDAGRQALCPLCGAITSVPLGRGPFSNAANPTPILSADDEPPNPYAPPAFSGDPFGKSQFRAPRRGATVLVLGIVGIVCCPICGPIAWIMGAGDLKSIDSGAMDPAERTQTQVGMVLGIIGTILGGCSIAFQILVLAARR